MRPVSPPRVLVFDPEPVWLQAIESTLGGAGMVVNATTSAAKALVLLRGGGFAVAMIGIDVSGFDWEHFVERARGLAEACRIIVVSHDDPARRVERALRLGAEAYVVKRAEPEDLVFAVRQALSPAVYQVTTRSEVRPTNARRPSESRPPLTRREEEILALLTEGHSNAGIAERLAIKEATVKGHLFRLYRKIGVNSRTAAASWAVAEGRRNSA